MIFILRRPIRCRPGGSDTRGRQRLLCLSDGFTGRNFSHKDPTEPERSGTKPCQTNTISMVQQFSRVIPDQLKSALIFCERTQYINTAHTINAHSVFSYVFFSLLTYMLSVFDTKFDRNGKGHFFFPWKLPNCSVLLLS